ncbi:MAG: hypothetical protein AB7U73_17105 [Pirellulales bacterium]
MNAPTLLACSTAAATIGLAHLADSPWPELGNLSATAILGWYAWHTAARTIPDLVRAFRDESAAQRALLAAERHTGRDDLEALRAEHVAERRALREELAAERTQRHADQQAIVAALEQLSACLASRVVRD